MKNKKGAEMTIGTIVIIVLALIVLVVLILGFALGWGSMWGTLTSYFSPVNVDTVKQSCQYACSTQSEYEFCCRIRDVKYVKGEDAQKKTCKTMGEICPEINCKESSCTEMICKAEEGKVEPLTDLKASCKDGFEEDTARKLDVNLNVVKCCKIKVKCSDLGGEWKSAACEQGKEDLTNQVKDDSDQGANKFCCKT